MIDDMLRLRKFEKCSDGLEGKIIAASYGIAQKVSFASWLRGVFRELNMPSPAYALSVVFLAGMFLSFGMSSEINAGSLYDIVDDVYIVEGELL